jgi:hypothetical protein
MARTVSTEVPAGIKRKVYGGTGATGILWLSASPRQLISFDFESSSPPFFWNTWHEFGTGILTYPAALGIVVYATPQSSDMSINNCSTGAP